MGLGMSFRLGTLVVGLVAAIIVAGLALFGFEDASKWDDIACHSTSLCFGLDGCVHAENSDHVVACSKTNSTTHPFCGELFWNRLKTTKSIGSGIDSTDKYAFSGFSQSAKCLAYWNVEAVADDGLAMVMTCGVLAIVCRGAVVGVVVEDAFEAAAEVEKLRRRNMRHSKRWNSRKRGVNYDLLVDLEKNESTDEGEDERQQEMKNRCVEVAFDEDSDSSD
jgi:hypothetical protein